MHNFDSFSFGPPAAERDNSLVNYFCEIPAYNRIENGSKSVILGNRGSGKSAIFKFLAHEKKKQGAIVIELTPEHYSYEMLSQTLASEREGSWAKFGAYTVAWQYLIYVLTMKELTNGGKSFKKGSAGKIYSYLRDNHEGFADNPIAIMISYLKRLEGIKISQYEAAIKSRKLDRLYKLEEITELIPDIKELCRKTPVHIFVDELDKGWDASEDAQAFVAGLFQACISINDKVDHLHVYMSLRKEIYERIPALYDDIQKYRDIVEIISWDYESLLALVAKRIRHELDLRNDDNIGTWNAVFLDTLEYRNTKSFKYISSRTLFRPREIIQFCNYCVEIARDKFGQEAFPIRYNPISEAEIKYSVDRTDDICSEYRFQYPGLKSVFETFRGRKYRINKDDLWEHLYNISERKIKIHKDCSTWCVNIDPDELIKILWEVGFLQAYIAGQHKAIQTQGSSYIGSHQVTTLNLDSVTRFQIHPMFRSALGLKEK